MTREDAAEKLEAITFWVGGGNLWYWDGMDLKQWTSEGIDFNSCEVHDYILQDKDFKERCKIAWKMYAKQKLTMEEEIERVMEEIKILEELAS